jgi:rRNA maturation endonuclease Nob1
MYRVILHPKKCDGTYLWIADHREGDIIEIAENRYQNHIKHGCMEIIEQWRIKTVKRGKCPICGQSFIKRKKVKLWKE